MPRHHNLEEYLTAYLDGAGLRSDPRDPLFHTIGRGTGQPEDLHGLRAKLLRGLLAPSRRTDDQRGRSPAAAPCA
jgi:hypothetical protein